MAKLPIAFLLVLVGLCTCVYSQSTPGKQLSNNNDVSGLISRADIPGVGLAEIKGNRLTVMALGDA